jgi:predicted nuclease of predicted toxin-antitoxin system
MNILSDENIPNITLEELRSLQHDVLDIRGTPKQGMFDDELWTLAQADQRVLITTDKGFTQYRDEDHFGILVIRLRQPNEQQIHSRIMAAIREFAPSEWRGLLVVMRDKVRTLYRSKKAKGP